MSSARADMVPVSQFVWGYGHVPSVGRPDVTSHADGPDLFDGPGRSGLASVTVDVGAQAETEGEPVALTQGVRILADGQGSFSLCLYALLGVGLWKSAPLARKLSFGGIPQWYHDGGPTQIGHRLAIAPDCLCAAPACFIQPDRRTEDPIPRYHFATVVSLWRSSQFTAAVLASRAPPSLS